VSRSCPTCGSTYADDTSFCGDDGAITIEDQSGQRFDPRLGKQLGDYIVVARVADGAMGRVYEGRHVQTRERVAVKVLHEHVARDRIAVERFKREYDTARELDSPYIVKVLEFGETFDGSYFLTMEYLTGQELTKALAPKQPLPLSKIVRSIAQIGLALEHAHSYGFIHRDLKPDNVFLCDTESGVQVRLLDFGSVKLQVEIGPKLTTLGTTLGSPFYMSPEQATGASDVDQRSDVFALGAILYEMLTGKVAFDAPSVALILMRILNHNPAPPSGLNPAAGSGMDAVVAKALYKDKLGRYPSARELAQALLSALALEGSVEDWAQKPESELTQALGNTQPPSAAGARSASLSAAGTAPPPPPPPMAASTLPPPSAAGASTSVPPRRSEVDLVVPKRKSSVKWIAVAIGLGVLGLLLLLLR
jgi:serine/threonine protein kinase